MRIHWHDKKPSKAAESSGYVSQVNAFSSSPYRTIWFLQRKDFGMKKELRRNTGVDLAKAIAICGVVIIHNCSHGYASKTLSFDWITTVLLRSLVSPSVPLFFMCSGALLLNPEKEISIKSLYTKRLLRIVLALLFWAFSYKLFDLLITKSLSAETLVQSIKELFLFRHKFHLYFLHIILIVYIWLPITRSFTKHASQKEVLYFLCVWFLFGIVYPTVRGFWPFNLLSGIPLQWLINMTYAAIGYAVLGFYLSQHPISWKLSVLFLFAGCVCVFGGTTVASFYADTLVTKYFEGMSIGVSIIAVGAFGLCSLEFPLAGTRFVRNLSRASFCVYLVHVFFISILQGLGVMAVSPFLLTILLVSFLNVMLSYGVYVVLNRIPIIRDWII